MVKKSATNDQQECNARRKHSSHASSRSADAHAAAHADYISKSAVHCEDVSMVVKHHNADMSQGAPQKEKKKKRLVIPPVRPLKPPEYKKGPRKSSSGGILNSGQKLAMGDRMTFEAALVIKDELEKVSVPARSALGIWVDCHGTPMVAYFGDEHGVPDRIICDKHYETQQLFALQPKLLMGSPDQCHEDDFKDQDFVLGKSKATLVPSADLMGSTNGSNSARRHIQTATIVYADNELTDLLTQYVKVAFPEKYAALSSSTRAGRWVGTPIESAEDHGGIFLGCATLWKLQTFLHLDGKDFLCVILSSGKYTGGEALFPDLSLKLKYSPGHVIVFQSEALYHATAKWKALPMDQEDIFTPGKVTWVYFSPADVVKKLQDKENNWFLQTAGGVI
ncbi:hypothetical protein DFH29DRAFT_1002792 [Suillus ampliporus]|nr:hypothetical protein DFH29DRAFT_1002792 [Suillus ampliporus]